MKSENLFLYIYLSLLIFALFFIGINSLIKGLTQIFVAYLTEPLRDPPQVQTTFALPPKLPPPEIKAEAVLAVKIFPSKKEKILIEKNSSEVLPIASLTKLMTALLVFENKDTYNLSDGVTVISRKAANQPNSMENGSLDKKIGEKISLMNLLELALIYSSNDAAFALAEIEGIDNFVEKMNQKAKEIGMENTYFLNPTGLDVIFSSFSRENLFFFNRASAKDLFILSKYILEFYPQIFDITQKGKHLPIQNSLSGIILKDNEKMVGGKTGFTRNAKGSILFVFEDGKKATYVIILLGVQTPEERIGELQKIIDWIHQ